MLRPGEWLVLLMLALTAVGCKDDGAWPSRPGPPVRPARSADLVGALDRVGSDPRSLVRFAEALRQTCGSACACLDDVMSCPSVCSDEVRRSAASAAPTERMPALVAACGLGPLGLTAETASLISTDWLVARVAGQYLAEQLVVTGAGDARALAAAMLEVELPLRPSQPGLAVARHRIAIDPAGRFVTIDRAGTLRAGPLPVARLTRDGALLGPGDRDLVPRTLDDVGELPPLLRSAQTSGVVVLADREASAAQLREVLAAVPVGWTLAVEGPDGVAAFPPVLSVAADPAARRPGGTSELVLEVSDAAVSVRSSSRSAEYGRVGTSDPVAIAAVIAVARQSPLFGDETDLVVEIRADASVATLIAVLDAALDAGTTAIRLDPWSPPVHHPGATPARVVFGQVSTAGDLEKSLIRHAVRGHQQAFLRCYRSELAERPDTAGTVNTQFFINPAGVVIAVGAQGVSPSMKTCVMEAIRQIAFPKPKGGGGVQVNYPLSFVPRD